jgi:hypothetical protein
VYLRGCKYVTVYLDKKPYFRCILRPGPEYDGISFDQTLFFSHLAYEIEQYRPPRSLPYISPKLKQTCETAQSPCGLLWKFIFHSNHGDDYYIGLDHLEFYDNENQLIEIEKSYGRICALPHSVRDLSISSGDPLNNDPRTPEQLLNAQYFQEQQQKKTCCWLSPLARCMTGVEREASMNRMVSKFPNQDLYNKKKTGGIFPKENVVMVQFNYPVSVSAIR